MTFSKERMDDPLAVGDSLLNHRSWLKYGVTFRFNQLCAPKSALHIHVQNSVLDHLTPNGCGEFVILSDILIEVLLGVIDVGLF